MPVNKSRYVCVNIWTSQQNQALKEGTIKHVSLAINGGKQEEYISLWPDGRKPYKADFFHEIEQIGKHLFSNHLQRPASYQQSYEKDCILEALTEKRFRQISSISQCFVTELPYWVNIQTAEFGKLTYQPKTLKPQEQMWAIRLVPANFRMVLFSLDVDKILKELHCLKDPKNSTGWSMVCPNFITRNLNYDGKTTENCASIMYRCLKAGGLYNHIKSKLSLQPSSVVTPDDLLSIIVTAKASELNLYTGNPEEWMVPNVQQTSLDKVIAAYEKMRQNANPKADTSSGSTPSAVSCCIL